MGTYRGRRGPFHIPEELADAIVSVNGLDERPVARPKVAFVRTIWRACRELHTARTGQTLLFSYTFQCRPGAMHRHHRTRWRISPERP